MLPVARLFDLHGHKKIDCSYRLADPLGTRGQTRVSGPNRFHGAHLSVTWTRVRFRFASPYNRSKDKLSGLADWRCVVAPVSTRVPPYPTGSRVVPFGRLPYCPAAPIRTLTAARVAMRSFSPRVSARKSKCRTNRGETGDVLPLFLPGNKALVFLFSAAFSTNSSIATAAAQSLGTFLAYFQQPAH